MHRGEILLHLLDSAGAGACRPATDIHHHVEDQCVPAPEFLDQFIPGRARVSERRLRVSCFLFSVQSRNHREGSFDRGLGCAIE